MKPVKSSVGHSNGVLAVRFHSGVEWHYPNVPADVYTGMMKAESVGKFFNTHIKGTFDGAKQDAVHIKRTDTSAKQEPKT